jgi:hypothetical protein
VAVSGTTVVVGATGSGNGTGAAYVFTRSGSTWTQQAKLTAAHGAAGDSFGYSVALSGTTAVVGAIGSNSFTGAAYVFTGSGSTWSQQAELTAVGGAAGDHFGSSVTLSGSTAVVGAPGTSNGGTACVFTRSGSTWTERATLFAVGGATGDQFGSSVTLSGSTMVVGAEGTNSFTGAAYVFTGSGAHWPQQAELTAADGAAGDIFGSSVALSGSTAMVGAPGKSSLTGAVYMFARSGGTWSQQAELTASPGAANDIFGHSVALAGTTAVVGAYGDNSSTGAAFVFVLPSQQTRLTGAAEEDLGSSVALSGSTAVVGAPGSNMGTGAAYVFVRSGSTWTQQAKLTAADGAFGDFGWSVAISGSTAVVGAVANNSFTGAAYVFVRSGSTWSQQAELTAADGAANDFFGNSVAVSGSTVLVGAPDINSFTGAAYVFIGSGGTWSQQAELTAADFGPNAYFGASVALSGGIAVVGATGENTTGSAYVFTGSGSTWTQRIRLFGADAQPGDAFGVSVAISGSTVVAGADGRSPGVAYVFTGHGGTWAQHAELAASDGTANDLFGSSVAVSGSTVVVGAFGKNSDTGAAYVFARSGSIWPQQFELTAPSDGADDFFGWSAAVSGSTAMVGAPASNKSAGAANVFVNV